MSQDREPNSHLCAYFGRKLGNIHPEIEVLNGGYAHIGSDRDDEIYFDVIEGKYVASKSMLRERVQISLFRDGETVIKSTPEGEILMQEEHMIVADLEDVLKFAAEYCEGIMIKVMQERGLM